MGDSGHTEITQTAEAIHRLTALDVVRLPGTLLPELTTLDRAERDLRTVRDAVLDQARSRGASWNTIAAMTRVASTTWRGRLDRYREAQKP